MKETKLSDELKVIKEKLYKLEPTSAREYIFTTCDDIEKKFKEEYKKTGWDNIELTYFAKKIINTLRLTATIKLTEGFKEGQLTYDYNYLTLISTSEGYEFIKYSADLLTSYQGNVNPSDYESITDFLIISAIRYLKSKGAN